MPPCHGIRHKRRPPLVQKRHQPLLLLDQLIQAGGLTVEETRDSLLGGDVRDRNTYCS